MRAAFHGHVPRIGVHGGTVQIIYPRFRPFDWRTLAAEVSLAPHVPWAVSLRGGVSRLAADLTGLRLTGLDLGAGVSDARIALPRPQGVVRILVAGGVSDLHIVRPAGVAATVEVLGGASGVRLDELALDSVGGPVRWTSPDADRAADRYEITIAGGVSGLVVGVGTAASFAAGDFGRIMPRWTVPAGA